MSTAGGTPDTLCLSGCDERGFANRWKLARFQLYDEPVRSDVAALADDIAGAAQ
jgi:hypothetical protein